MHNMKDEVLVNIKGVASILIKLSEVDERIPLTQLLDIVPTYARLLEIIELLEAEDMLVVTQGAKSNQRKVSLTIGGREYAEHIIAAENLRNHRKVTE